jgi:hypothetical protein
MEGFLGLGFRVADKRPCMNAWCRTACSQTDRRMAVCTIALLRVPRLGVGFWGTPLGGLSGKPNSNSECVPILCIIA